MHDNAFLAAWADALDSGDFPQGRGALRGYDSLKRCDCYCVLGVGIEVLRDALADSERQTVDWVNLSTSYAVHMIAEYSGLTKGNLIRLVELNDSYRCPFSYLSQFVRDPQRLQ